MSLPIRVAVIAPADKPWPVPSSQLMGKVSQYMRRLQNWTKAEIGCTFDYELYWLTSKYTHEHLALEERQSGEKIDRRDPRDGKGGDEGKIWNKCCREELGWKTEIEGANVMRWIAVVNHFGGWAGGRNNQPNEDTGTALLGDYNILKVLQRTDAAEMASDGHAFGHEVTHLFGVGSHPGNLLPDLSTVPAYLEPLRDGDLTVGQKHQLITKNMRFLRDV